MNKIQFAILAVLVVLAFVILTIPGSFATWLYFNVVVERQQLGAFDDFVVSKVLPSAGTVVARFVTLLAAAFPVAVMRVCYRNSDPSALSWIGIVCLLLSLAAAAMAFARVTMINPNNSQLIKDVAPSDTLLMLKSLCDSALGASAVYVVAFLGLRPKS